MGCMRKLQRQYNEVFCRTKLGRRRMLEKQEEPIIFGYSESIVVSYSKIMYYIPNEKIYTITSLGNSLHALCLPIIDAKSYFLSSLSPKVFFVSFIQFLTKFEHCLVR